MDSTIEALGLKHIKSPLPGGGYLISIDVYESDAAWPHIESLLCEKDGVNVFETIFTPEEIRQAEWVRLLPSFEQGYPQPQGSWVTEPVNYRDKCPACGVFEQVASFRLKKEPRLGKHHFMSLFWTRAVFCRPEVFEELEAHGIQGYEKWEAVMHKTGVSSQEVTQLYIPTVAHPGLVRVEDLRRDVCPVCGITKYYPHMRGVMYMQRDALVPHVDIMQSHEWYGSGHAAYREILISNRFAQLILDNGWRGVRMKMVELVDQP